MYTLKEEDDGEKQITNEGLVFGFQKLEDPLAQAQRDLIQEYLNGEVKTIYKPWSESFVVKLFGREIVDGKIFHYTLGSGGLLNYRGRYFLVTNEHVVSSIPIGERLEKVYVPIAFGTKYIATFFDHAEDKDSDIAVFECAEFTGPPPNFKQFIDTSLLNFGAVELVQNKMLMTFLHGYPYERTEVDESTGITVETLYYCTYAMGYDEDSEKIILMARPISFTSEGILTNDTPSFSGMSGSFVYSYHPESTGRFRVIGLLSNGNKEAGLLWVIPIEEVITFIERKFFPEDEH